MRLNPGVKQLKAEGVDEFLLFRFFNLSIPLREHNRQNAGSSKRIRRFLLLREPPDVGKFEITDKGYVNQSEVQRRRAEQVLRLYRQPLEEGVVDLE